MSTANRGRKRQAPTESSSYSETNDNLSADDGVSVPGTATYDETFSQISGGRRRRRKFSLQRRDEVAKVRKIGACVECRARKVRVCQLLMCRVRVIPLFKSQMLILRSVVLPCSARDRCPSRSRSRPGTETVPSTTSLRLRDIVP